MPAEISLIGCDGSGPSRQSFMVKNLPLKSDWPCAHSSFITVTYSVTMS